MKISRKQHALLEKRRLQKDALESLTGDWFAEQRAYFDSTAKMVALIKGRRAGATYGLAGHYVRTLLTEPGARLLYINSTLDECRRLFWIGLNSDGVYSLVRRLGLDNKYEIDRTRLTIHNPETDGWLYLRGAKDEIELSKALGMAYTEVTWDEAQKIRSTMVQPIREILTPTLLETGGRFRLQGTANRQQSGIFWDLTQPDAKRRTPGWEIHHWNLLANPMFGRAVKHADGFWYVHALRGKAEKVDGPYASFQIAEAVSAARMRYGMQALAESLSVPLDSPIIQREGYGVWTPEDSAYVYAIRKASDPYYAPARLRADGFPDIKAALEDLPYDWREGFFSMGADLGYRDAFALHCWSWHPHDPNLYELFSWKKELLDSDQQFAAIKEVREGVALGQVVVDAGGSGKGATVAWSKAFVERYAQPIVPAEKHQKDTFQQLYNTDIANNRVKFRDGSETAEEMHILQWSKLVTGGGKLVEDPTQDNHCCDASLYSFRASWAYRYQPAEAVPTTQSERNAKLEQEIENAWCNPPAEDYPSCTGSFLGRGRYIPGRGRPA